MRQKLLEAAENMVRARGLDGASFQDLADAVGLSKPSVFHHFRNKEALAKALIQRCAAKQVAQFEAILQSASPAPTKLVEIAAIHEADLKLDRLSFLNAISGNAATLPDAAQADLSRVATDVIDVLARLFEQGRQEKALAFNGDAKVAATAFLAMLQGLQGLARAMRNRDIFRQSVAAYIAQLETGPADD